MSTVTIPFSDLHIEEARSNDHPSWQEIIAKVPAGIEVLTVDVSS